MSVQSLKAPAFANIPKLDCVVGTATGNSFTIWTKGDCIDFIRMSGTTFEALTVMNIPKLYCAIATTAHYGLTIRTEGD
jgi:hypothetical protein